MTETKAAVRLDVGLLQALVAGQGSTVVLGEWLGSNSPRAVGVRVHADAVVVEFARLLLEEQVRLQETVTLGEALRGGRA